jgi:hypothetical protein
MYIFAEPYDEDEIDAIQTGDYIRALRVWEKQSRELNAAVAKAASTEAASESTTPTEPSAPAEPEVGASMEAKAETDSQETEDDEGLQNLDFETPRDMLPMVLRSRNYINGQLVQGTPQPSADDKWEIGYSFEVSSPERGLKVYQMCQERRRKALDDGFREQLLGDTETAKRLKAWTDAFLMHLKDLSTRGKKWREEFDQMFGSKEKIVWKEGVPPSKFNPPAWKASQEEQEKSASDDGET